MRKQVLACLLLRGTERNVPQRDEVKIGVTH